MAIFNGYVSLPEGKLQVYVKNIDNMKEPFSVIKAAPRNTLTHLAGKHRMGQGHIRIKMIKFDKAPEKGSNKSMYLIKCKLGHNMAQEDNSSVPQNLDSAACPKT